ncbi:hypothetical protein Cgig2_021367 [Carnegiea gigantea]|uniref:Cytochrome P450 n=1 Tax=Carnegiea gigantea TaxID=171969 RepID=A0A9Q1KDT6_9CARY|nr:hypothetical protein Cgig2_021367 [Carnegiea gigantea]
MEKAQNEIREVLKLEGKEIVDETSSHDLKYLKQVIKETLRLHPTVPFLVPRESMERCEIQDYEIPSKARIFINAWAIGRDTKYWTEPEILAVHHRHKKETPKKMVSRSDKIHDHIIHDHISNKTQLDVADDGKDLVDVLLTFYKGDDSYDFQFSLSMQNIKSIILTSSTMVEWAMSELLKNPRVMEKAQSQTRQASKLHGKEVVDETTTNELEYLKQDSPPVPFLIPGESMELCQIQGYEMPSKARIFINAREIKRDTKYWTQPESFYPEKFETSTVDYKVNLFELIPFQASGRMCPGVGLGMAKLRVHQPHCFTISIGSCLIKLYPKT